MIARGITAGASSAWRRFPYGARHRSGDPRSLGALLTGWWSTRMGTAGYSISAANAIGQLTDLGALGNNLTQSTTAKKPLLLPWAGTNFAYLPGVTGNYLSTPHAAAYNVTNLQIDVDAALDDWTTPSAYTTLASKWNATTSFIFFIEQTTGKLGLTWFNGVGNVSQTSSVAPTVAARARMQVRATLQVDDGAGHYVLKFWTSTDLGANWTQLGATRTGASTTTLATSTTAIEVGSRSGGATEKLAGLVYGFKLYSNIGGTVIADPQISIARTAATSLTGAAGETWTVNATGTQPAQIVGFPCALFNSGATQNLAATFTFAQPCTLIALLRQNTWGSGNALLDGGAGAGLGQLLQTGSTPSLSIKAANTACANNAATLGTWRIVTMLLNGAASSLAVDNGTPVTGDIGAGTPGGLTLGADGAGAHPSAVQFADVVALNVAADTATIARVKRYLSRAAYLGL